MSHKDAPPLTDEQLAMEAFYRTRMESRGTTVGWGRDKYGEYLSEFARDAWEAWKFAQRRHANAEILAQERARKPRMDFRNHDAEAASLAPLGTKLRA